MISWIKGICRERTAKGVVVETSGFGLFIETPLTVLKNFQGIREEIELWLHMTVTEDAIRLFGFQDRFTRDLFQLLISISGIGPKLALAIVSTLSLQSLVQAVSHQRPEVLENVPGVGKRTAERLLVELKSKRLDELSASALSNRQGGSGQESLDASSSFEVNTIPFNQNLTDLKSALDNLGFKEKDYSRIVNQLGAQAATMEFAELIRHSLKLLAPN
jgi:holliday junction DNA helicase RuvA